MPSSPTSRLEISLPQIHVTKTTYAELVFSLVFVWGFGDAMSTILALVLTSDLSLEANPWIRALLAHDPMWMLALKFAVALYVGVVLLECRHLVEQVPGWRVWLFSLLGLGTAVVLTNVYVGLAAAI
ncbi:DUF5658 family protein [Haloarculaceae archaeon H-GB11]|nr:DUF5658 family protein [Haloarculaceae archaeon H-GB11]